MYAYEEQFKSRWKWRSRGCFLYVNLIFLISFGSSFLSRFFIRKYSQRYLCHSSFMWHEAQRAFNSLDQEKTFTDSRIPRKFLSKLCNIAELFRARWFSSPLRPSNQLSPLSYLTRCCMRVKIQCGASTRLLPSSNRNKQNYKLISISPSSFGDARYFAFAHSEMISREYFNGSPYVVDFHLILTLFGWLPRNCVLSN